MKYIYFVSHIKVICQCERIKKINVHRFYCNKLTYKLSALANDLSLYSILSKKILEFIKNSEVEILHIHDIQIAKAAKSNNKVD